MDWNDRGRREVPSAVSIRCWLYHAPRLTGQAANSGRLTKRSKPTKASQMPPRVLRLRPVSRSCAPERPALRVLIVRSSVCIAVAPNCGGLLIAPRGRGTIMLPNATSASTSKSAKSVAATRRTAGRALPRTLRPSQKDLPHARYLVLDLFARLAHRRQHHPVAAKHDLRGKRAPTHRTPPAGSP